LSFGSFRRQRFWTAEIIEKLRLVAQVFASALARKRASEALQLKNRYINTILEQAPIGFAVHTVDDGLGRFVSARFEEIYGVPPGTIDSYTTFFDKVWPHNPDFREQIRGRVTSDMTSGDPSRMHWENVPVWSADGEIRYITALNIPVLDQNLMVSTVRDVTARVRAQQALRKAKSDSEASSKDPLRASIGPPWKGKS